MNVSRSCKHTLSALGAAAALVLALSPSAFAADAGAYSYLSGQQRSSQRNTLYAQAAAIADEAERETFLLANGIADTPYSAETAAGYSYVAGRQRGALYADPDKDRTGYQYLTGQQRGASYAP